MFCSCYCLEKGRRGFYFAHILLVRTLRAVLGVGIRMTAATKKKLSLLFLGIKKLSMFG